jgi:hypothetical protein
MAKDEQTLKVKLIRLRDRIDTDYTTRIDEAATDRVVEIYEKKAVRMLNAIDRVIEWAAQYGID